MDKEQLETFTKFVKGLSEQIKGFEKEEQECEKCGEATAQIEAEYQEKYMHFYKWCFGFEREMEDGECPMVLFALNHPELSIPRAFAMRDISVSSLLSCLLIDLHQEYTEFCEAEDELG